MQAGCMAALSQEIIKPDHFIGRLDLWQHQSWRRRVSGKHRLNIRKAEGVTQAIDPDNAFDAIIRLAVRLARRACEATRRGNPVILDTLAAAQAEAGLFEQAVRTAQDALHLAKDRPKLLARLEARLGSYRARRPWREAPKGNAR